MQDSACVGGRAAEQRKGQRGHRGLIVNADDERWSSDLGVAGAIEKLQREGVQAVGEAGAVEEITEGCVVPQEELGEWAHGITADGGADGYGGDRLEDVVRAVPIGSRSRRRCEGCRLS